MRLWRGICGGQLDAPTHADVAAKAELGERASGDASANANVAVEGGMGPITFWSLLAEVGYEVGRVVELLVR